MLTVLKAYRLHRGKSQADLSAETGINQVKLSRIERGENKLKEKDIERLSKVLDIAPGLKLESLLITD